ncbi:amidohydrolase family protein [Tsukamurella tyrosinosolvens]|uniref:amidohydrolase family protein n=1 Tax=Tsukamurella tyrosinosolvens TaxID=57704 RepID=UPI002DD4512F|nr:amidohydrolase family protein [Tsukamurella tyrosinosolvens]MEC4612581.1 amidohydrolase family protein [Tsukamurella tyrosinosolvens]
MHRIDVHHHLIPSSYRDRLAARGIGEAGGRELPAWSPEGSLGVMDRAGVATAILSVSTPGTTFLDDPVEAASLARDLNDETASVVAAHPDRFGFFATLPTPDIEAATAEARRALDDLHADGVVLLANARGTYLGEAGQEPLFRALDERSATVFIHPADLPAPAVTGIPPFAADFLLDTTRAAYLLVSNGIRRRYPNIRFILSHAGGFVPYASHRMAVAIAGASGRSPLDVLDDFSSFYFDTALSASPAALPSLLAFADPGHVLFGSDWPFAPEAAVQYFAAGLDDYTANDADLARRIERDNALALFPRLGTPAPIAPPALPDRVRGAVTRTAMRAVTRLIATT